MEDQLNTSQRRLTISKYLLCTYTRNDYEGKELDHRKGRNKRLSQLKGKAHKSKQVDRPKETLGKETKEESLHLATRHRAGRGDGEVRKN